MAKVTITLDLQEKVDAHICGYHKHLCEFWSNEQNKDVWIGGEGMSYLISDDAGSKDYVLHAEDLAAALVDALTKKKPAPKKVVVVAKKKRGRPKKTK